MVDSSVRFQPSTLPEAARILGVSESTVRRLVKAGKLEAERVLRPQGHVWMVMVPASSTGPSEDPPRWVGASPANPPEQPAAGSATSPALATWMTSVLEPLIVELGTSRQRIEDLARENGRQSVELERARVEIDALTSSAALETAQSTPRAPGTFLRAWARLDWLIVALVAAVVVAGVLLVWPR